MTDPEDSHGVVLQGEQDPVIAVTQPEPASHITVQSSQIAAAGASVVKNPIEDAHGGGSIQAAYVGPGFVEPFDSKGRNYLLSGKSSGLNPKSASTSSMGMPLPPR